jgi:hypothetical protein
MFETLLDLPLHVLVIHAVVVGVPVAALATAAVALRTSWRLAVGWWVVLLNAAMVAATYVARQSGLWFYDRLGEPPPAADHRALGINLVWFVLALLAASVLLMLVGRAGGVLLAVVALVAVVAAGAAAVQTVRVGHSGSEAVWKGTVTSS